MTQTTKRPADKLRYRVVGMDCTSCVAKVEAATRQLRGVSNVKVSLASGLMDVEASDLKSLRQEVPATIEKLGYRVTLLEGNNTQPAGHLAPSYRRALWIVVLLNAGYGLIEIVGGIIAGSQALKADALDFIGDGTISWIGLLALSWGITARAKAALVQGIFLAALGVGVLAMTMYRVLVVSEPEPTLMGVFGLIALAVNVAAAAVLIPHRKGDANMRAVWLFSRNDAVGNFAVVVAAGLVAWTGSYWPDLVVAAIIAGVFLHSAVLIIQDARKELDGTA